MVKINLIAPYKQNKQTSFIEQKFYQKIPSIQKFTNPKLNKQSIKKLIKKQSDINFNKTNNPHLLNVFYQKKIIKTQNNAEDQFKMKTLRFRDRTSIQNQSMKFKIMEGLKYNVKQISTSSKFIKEKDNRKQYPSIKFLKNQGYQQLKLVIDLINSFSLSKNTALNQLKCFMCYYSQHNSELFDKKIIKKTKQKLKQITIGQFDKIFFSYEAFQTFLQNLSSINYNSDILINSFVHLIENYHYPISIRLMFYYLGNYLYQFNDMYQKAQFILSNMLNQILTQNVYIYLGIYLLLMIKLKGNLLEWQTSIKYLTKLLVYSWLFKFQNLQIWTYFQLSRCYFFLNNINQSQYFQQRSQMSKCQSHQSIYRQMLVKQFILQINQMKKTQINFNLNNSILRSNLMKIQKNIQPKNQKKYKNKIQTQIKNIHQHCKIKYVKNLLNKIKMSPKNSQILSCYQSQIYSYTKKNQINTPILKTQQSGLKNMNIYFRNNRNLQNKNKKNVLYTYQNSSQNLLFLKQICRNILLQMKWIKPIISE